MKLQNFKYYYEIVDDLFQRVTSQVAVCRHLATAERVKYSCLQGDLII